MSTRYTIHFTDQPGAKARYRTALRLMGATEIRLSEAEVDTTAPKPKRDNLPTSDEARAVAALFNRPLDRPWMEEEIKAFKEAVKTGLVTLENMNAITEHYRTHKGREGHYLRTSILTFCRHFGTELDKARTTKPTGSKKGEWLDSQPKIIALPDPAETERLAQMGKEQLSKFRKGIA